MANLLVHPVTRPVDGTVRVPGSKSITNRALLLAALARGRSRLDGALFSDDTAYMSTALRQLGCEVEMDEAAERFEVEGCGGQWPVTEADVFLGNAGTAVRFLLSALCLGTGNYFVDGVPRMRQRPLNDLLDALRQLGAEIVSETGCVPLEVHAHGMEGGEVRVRGDASSQFLSSLLLVGPLTRRGLNIEIDGPLYSQPYVALTLQMLEQWGAIGSHSGMQSFSVPGEQRYQPREYVVEPDASSASYFFAAAALTGGRVRVKNLGRNALQGDVDFVDVLAQMGCEVKKGNKFVQVRGPEGGRLLGVDVDMNAISDTVMTLAAIAPLPRRRSPSAMSRTSAAKKPTASPPLPPNSPASASKWRSAPTA